jgi:hypothetical protein
VTPSLPGFKFGAPGPGGHCGFGDRASPWHPAARAGDRRRVVPGPGVPGSNRRRRFTEGETVTVIPQTAVSHCDTGHGPRHRVAAPPARDRRGHRPGGPAVTVTVGRRRFDRQATGT